MNSGADMKFEKICRTCLGEGSFMRDLFETEANSNLQYDEMIMSVTKVMIIKNDGLPSKLCETCASQIQKLLLFKTKCEEADDYLKTIVQNSLSNVVLENKTHQTSNSNNNSSTFVNNGDSIKSDDSNSLSESEITTNSKKENKHTSIPAAFGCRKCDLHFLSWKELDSHNSNHKNVQSNHKIMCRYCDKTFLHQRCVNPHVRKMHSELERFQCGYCGKRWKDIRNLRIHLSKHSSSDNSVSLIYKLKSENLNNCIQERNNPNETLFRVEFDSVLLDSKNINSLIDVDYNKTSDENLCIELIKTQSNDLMCNSCGQIFANVKLLQSHMVETHNANSQLSANDSLEQNQLKNTEHMEMFDEIQMDQSDDCDISKNEKNKMENTDNVSQTIKTKKYKCDICGKYYRSNYDLKRHEATHDPDKPFHCQFDKCSWSFGSEHELLIHCDVNHSDGTNECRFCHKTFKHVRNLRQHMRQHQLIKRFKCTYCDKDFNHLHHLQNHERVHTGDLPFLCQKCGRGFATKDRLNIHVRYHSNVRPFSCQTCDKKFVAASDLKSHMRIHLGQRDICPICGKTFSTDYNLNKHISIKHNCSQDDSSTSFSTCNVCGFLAETHQELNKHMRSHTCQYFCPHCEKSFSQMSTLDAHIQTHSTENKSHLCTVCGSMFSRSEYLRRHIIRKHNGSMKSFECKQCVRKFTLVSDYNFHMRTHSKRKPYTCLDCGRDFTQSGTLKIHSRIHSGERPFICGVCHCSYRSASALAVHMRTHSTNITIHESKMIKNNKLSQEVLDLPSSSDIQLNDNPTILEIVKAPAIVNSSQDNELEVFQNSNDFNVLEKSDCSVDIGHLVENDGIIADISSNHVMICKNSNDT